jgi:hypothetical protein
MLRNEHVISTLAIQMHYHVSRSTKPLRSRWAKTLYLGSDCGRKFKFECLH